MRKQNAPVIVVGGGLGGVATAVTLGQQGMQVRLLEQSAEIAPIGYGVQIGPNVLPMLARLGLGEEVLQAAYLPDDILLLDARSGDTIFRIPLKGEAFERRFTAPYIAIHRVDLHEILLRACRKLPNVDLNQATTVTSYAQQGDTVQVRTADDRTISGSALIAADGLRSRLRAQLHPADIWRDTGYVAHRTIVPRDQAPSRMRDRRGVTMLTGAGFHVIYYPLRGGDEINMVGVFQVPAALEPADVEYGRHIAALTAGAVPEVQDVLGVLNMTRRWAIADREPVRRWHEGRVTLLGDAAHATLQSLAQGAGMALEDAVTLGELMVAHPDDPARAFAQFERKRFMRTARVVLESRALWPQFHAGGVEAEVRNAQWQERNAEDHYRCLDWLWNPKEERR
ncbi:MAG: putative n-hydroxybenzoate hydroxylase [Ramlibacter sp.]|jgi:2-polyprenyl-6-methoxyphenol hydroxylase-like FAD-dependent oxidoreductase|nr:putative n-hydroxybenzoate hydroxylase [Ramlibacter sp.]